MAMTKAEQRKLNEFRWLSVISYVRDHAHSDPVEYIRLNDGKNLQLTRDPKDYSRVILAITD